MKNESGWENNNLYEWECNKYDLSFTFNNVSKYIYKIKLTYPTKHICKYKNNVSKKHKESSP